MAFPTSHSHPDGTGNPALTWWRGPVRVLAQTEGGAKPNGERDRIPVGLVAVSTARLRSIAVETGNTRYADRGSYTHRFGQVPRRAEDDLARFGYPGNYTQMESDIRSLTRQRLVEQRTIEGHSSYSTKVLTLTKDGHRLLERAQLVSSRQATYHGLVKPKEARHDADLYRLYQKVAREIERSGGKVCRVVLDFELKKDLYQALSRMRPDKDSRYERISIANQFDLKVVDGKIPIPDLRIEYEDDCRDVRRLDLEIATRDYRPQGLGEKAKAGFHMSPGSKTTLNCAASSTPRKSARGSLPMKILPIHTEALRYFGYTEEESCFLYLVATNSGYSLPAVSSVHQDETRQTQRGLCPKSSGKEHARSKESFGMAGLSSLLAESL